MNSLGTLLDRARVREGASPSALAQFEQKHAVKLNRELREFFIHCGGGALDEISADLLSLDEASALLDTINQHWPSLCGTLKYWRLVPIVYDRESNYLMVSCSPQLSGRVLFFPHDDDLSVMFRSIESLAERLLLAADDGERLTDICHARRGDYDGVSQRDEACRTCGKSLLTADRVIGDAYSEACYASSVSLGCWLLDERDLDLLTKQFDGDPDIHQAIRDRLEALNSEAARAALVAHHDQVLRFAEGFREAMKLKGIALGEISSQHGSVFMRHTGWMDMGFFWSRRHAPRFLERAAQWLADQAAGRNPHHRPGHLMDEAADSKK